MAAKDVVIGLVVGIGVGTVLYGLAIQKEEPRTASTIFSLIGATAGLVGIATALTKREPTGAALGGISSATTTFRS